MLLITDLFLDNPMRGHSVWRRGWFWGGYDWWAQLASEDITLLWICFIACPQAIIWIINIHTKQHSYWTITRHDMPSDLFSYWFFIILIFHKVTRGKCSMTRDFTRHILTCCPNKWVAQVSPYGSSSHWELDQLGHRRYKW